MSSDSEKLSFEKSLEKLEAVVNAMEEGEIPLTELVEKFEEGSKLLKNCESQLKQAELKIEKLRQEEESVVLEAFEPKDES